ncbi:hypothetical protein ILUMI_06255, partial [Ignelater luminosus]
CGDSTCTIELLKIGGGLGSLVSWPNWLEDFIVSYVRISNRLLVGIGSPSQ